MRHRGIKATVYGVFFWYFCNDPILGIVREDGGPWDPLRESRSPQGRGGANSLKRNANYSTNSRQ
jgi:hypothetical protein